jgi:hypothetical protein
MDKLYNIYPNPKHCFRSAVSPPQEKFIETNQSGLLAKSAACFQWTGFFKPSYMRDKFIKSEILLNTNVTDTHRSIFYLWNFVLLAVFQKRNCFRSRDVDFVLVGGGVPCKDVILIASFYFFQRQIVDVSFQRQSCQFENTMIRLTN